jgi:thiosulfate/3-mercaptopyruvate sulfurtransferase
MTRYFLLLILFVVGGAFARQTEPWTPAQLLEPADLATEINHPPAQPPLLICVGPSGVIKGSVEAGPAKDASNLEKLKALLAKEDRNREVILYCGCCPFAHCPNVRPAFTVLTEMKFTHARLLNLAHNIKIDWIDHGYPVN